MASNSSSSKKQVKKAVEKKEETNHNDAWAAKALNEFPLHDPIPDLHTIYSTAGQGSIRYKLDY